VSATDTSNIDHSFRNLRIRRLAGRIGGEVQDFKLSASLDDPTIADLHAALVKHKVLFSAPPSTTRSTTTARRRASSAA